MTSEVESFTIDITIKGYLVYKDVWSTFTCYTIAVKKEVVKGPLGRHPTTAQPAKSLNWNKGISVTVELKSASQLCMSHMIWPSQTKPTVQQVTTFSKQFRKNVLLECIYDTIQFIIVWLTALLEYIYYFLIFFINVCLITTYKSVDIFPIMLTLWLMLSATVMLKIMLA